MENPRLTAQMSFLAEACRLKKIERQNVLQDLSRPENAAEHSWHVALYALVMDLPQLRDPKDRFRAIQMILLHDLVEIDAGDHPIDEDHDPAEVAAKEQAAADRLFGLLPFDQAARLRALWEEFEAAQSPAAWAAKKMDHVQPIFQTLSPDPKLADHVEVVKGNLTGGRARNLDSDWPEAHSHAHDLLNGTSSDDTEFAQRLAFLNEADRLKSVDRATRIHAGSRFENSAEHSWHLALYALVLEEHAQDPVEVESVITMLLVHDLVEIDAGDMPIFGTVDHSVKDAEETAAAQRIFGLLPADQGAWLWSLWQEFEAGKTANARFAKALDRFQPPNLNLASSGGSWVDYDAEFSIIEQKVAPQIKRGAPTLWDWVSPRIQDFLTVLRG